MFKLCGAFEEGDRAAGLYEYNLGDFGGVLVLEVGYSEGLGMPRQGWGPRCFRCLVYWC